MLLYSISVCGCVVDLNLVVDDIQLFYFSVRRILWYAQKDGSFPLFSHPTLNWTVIIRDHFRKLACFLVHLLPVFTKCFCNSRHRIHAIRESKKKILLNLNFTASDSRPNGEPTLLPRQRHACATKRPDVIHPDPLMLPPADSTSGISLITFGLII